VRSYVDAAGALVKVGAVSMAKLPNVNGLERVSGNQFTATTNSGPEVVALPGDSATGMGSIVSGCVEMSNVDLAREFTTMITAQRGYQANSRVISIADQMLQDLVNIGR